MRANLRVPILGALLLALSVLSCGREVTGPGGGTVAGSVSLRPVFAAVRVSDRVAPLSVSGLVEFVRVRVVLLRANGDTAVNRVVEFPADSQSIALTLPVVLSTTAGAEGETLAASLRYVNAAGDTVFRGGPISVQARPAGAPPVTPPEIPITYSGPGATAASIAITPRTFTGGSGGTVTFSATVQDAQGATLSNTPVAFLSSDTTMVQVGLRTGVATLKGLKGQATIFATTVTGQRDSAQVTVIAPPSQLGYVTQPTTVSAGTVLPAVRVVVLDAARDTIRGFVGTMRVALSGGPTGTTLGGTTRVTVNGGIARFEDLTVDRAGSGYRLVATLDSVSGVPAATSDTFSIAPGVPATITLTAGGAQTVPQGVAFPDSVVVRVTDRFGAPVPNAVVRFEVVLGEGTVSPPTVTTGTAGVAATQWTAGGPGPQRLRVSVDTLTPLTVDGIALASSGPPLLYVGTELASLGVGRTTPITAYLSNPARATTAITLRSRNDTIAQWATTTVTIPLNGTQTNAALTGRRLGSTWVVLESAVGTDSVRVTVDSTGMRFGPLPVDLLVTDTIRTAIVLDAPAPAGGLTVTVRSADSTRVRLAPGSGTGVLEQPMGDEFCYDCNALRAAGDEGQLLAPPSGTATLTVPAGQLSAQLIVLPVAPASDTTGAIALTASAPGVSAVTNGVFPIAATLSGDCFYCTIPVGHVDGMYLSLAAARRSPLPVSITTPDTAVVRLLTSSLTVPAGTAYAYPSRLVVGRSAGTARVIVSAPGFTPDTTVVTVLPPAIQLASFTGALLRIGSQLDLRVSLGYTDSTYGGFSYGSPLADTVAVTMTSSDTAVALPDFTRRVLAAGESDARFPVTGRRAGTATLTVSAPGYGTSTFGVEVLGGEVVFLTAPTTTGIGVVTPIEINLPIYGPTRLSATAFSITSSDTTALRVLTPRLTLASGASQVEGRIQGLAPGTVMLSVRRDTTLVATFTTQVVAPRLAITGAPARLESGESSEILLLTEADQVRSTSDLLLGVLRSTNPAVLQVTDSVLRFVPGEFGAVGVVRGVSAGTAALIASVPGYPSDTLATITVSAPRLVIPVSAGAIRTGPGVEWRLPVERQSVTRDSLPFNWGVSGSGGASGVGGQGVFRAGETRGEVLVRGGSTTGVDTLLVTAAGLDPARYVLPAAQSWFTLAGETAVPVETPFQVGGGLAMAPGFFDDSLTRRPVAATTLRYRLVSLDTGIVRVVDDTMEIAAGTSFATRLATARGLRPGMARLTATRLGTIGPVVDTVTVEVAPSRLWHNVAEGELRLGMQQRTEDDELFISREFPAPTPVWVRLTTSAPSVVTVPDSMLIAAGAIGAPLVVTAKDTVGTALITAQALGHEGASFTVTVTRARLLAFSPGNLVTGTRLPNLILPVAGNLFEDVGPVLRKHTAPIPVRLVSGDTTIARWVRDTLTIPVGEVVAEAVLVGQRAGTMRLTIEDRRTTFPRLTPIEGSKEVQPGLLQVTGGYMTYGGMPVVQAGVGLTSYPQTSVEIETNGYRDGLVVKFRSLKGRVAFTPDTVVLRDDVISEPTLRQDESIGLHGIVAGVDTVEISALGHRPDTVLVRIDKGYLETAGPVESTTLRVGDSTLVTLPLRSPSGDSAIVATGITLSVTASPTLAVSGAGVSAANVVRFSSLGVGSSHSCGIEVGTKRAFCWGANSFGQVGDSTAGISKAVPTPVKSPLGFTAVAAGMTSSCGIAEGGAAYCWGSNLFGQLGTGSASTSSVTTPIAVTGGLTFTQIAVGSDFACGLTGAGKVRCWGNNAYGQLGTGDTLPRRAPAVVNDDLTFSQLTTGYATTCALTSTGAAYCWGRNGSGLLAVGTTADQLTPAPVVGGLSFTQISAGDFHTCAVASGGAAFCWGSNGAGQLGVSGGTGLATTPQLVAAAPPLASISAGRQQTCGRTTGGAGYCWGINTYGQLGDGTTNLSVTPVAVSGGQGFAALQTGSGFTCGLVVSTAYCWGSNYAGELGVGFDRVTSAVPLALGDPSTVTLTLPAGATQARFWVKGVSVGTSKLTVTGAQLQTFELRGAVRAP